MQHTGNGPENESLYTSILRSHLSWPMILTVHPINEMDIRDSVIVRPAG